MDKLLWKRLVSLIQNRIDEYEEIREYWDGENDLPISVSQLQERLGTLFADFHDNLTRPIVEAAESRTRVTHFEGLRSKTAQEIWDNNNLGSEHRQIHTDAMVMGDTYVLVMPMPYDQTKAGIWQQITEKCAIAYDELDPRKKEAAMKWWVQEELLPNGGSRYRVRVNVYFEDRVERYISKRESQNLSDRFDEYERYSEGDTNWVTEHSVGEVPMFQVSVNPDLRRGHGRSDLLDSFSLIDAINKTVLDMLVSAEYTAKPQRYATGIEIPLDPRTGEPKETYKSGADRLWTSPNDSAKFGQLDAGDLKSYVSSIESLMEHLSVVSRTPTYALMKLPEIPSGESLKVLEQPLRSRVADHQDEFREAWQAIMAAALRVQGLEVDQAKIIVNLLPVNHPFNTTEFLEELKIKAEVLGVPEEKLWQEAGYTPDEIEEMKRMREEEATLGVTEFDQFAVDAVAIDGAPTTNPPAGLAPEA